MPTRFDGWAPHYDDAALQPAFHAAHRAVLQHAHELARAPGRVLDIGCGTGRLLQLMAQRFPHATLVGADPSAGMLAVAARGPGLFVRAAAEHLPFREGSFELVVSTASCRHWDDPFAALHEIGRVLALGATLCIADLFDPRRRDFPRLQPGAGLLAIVVATLAEAGLIVRQTQVVPGFGLVPSITVVVAERRPATASAADRAQPTASGLSAGPGLPLSAPVRVSPLLL
jgi:ubiquinone/menaquinone biosynthesis C-methylase UbiE